MERAAKRKSVFAWLLALLIVMGVFGENRAWGFFAQPQPAPGQIATASPTAIGENYDASRYDAPDYAVAAGTGGKPDFIVTEKGTVVPTNQAQMRQGFDDAGFSSKPTQSPGIERTLPDGSKVRTMEPSGPAPRRASFENANGQPVTPDGTVPQPSHGMTKAERKQFVRDRTHVEQQ